MSINKENEIRTPLIGGSRSPGKTPGLKPEELKMPLIQQYSKTPGLSVAHVYKLRPEELR
jgi:hypothetical protein